MFKKLILFFSFLLPISLFPVKIVDYKPEHKEAVTKIVFQNPRQLFIDSNFVDRVGCLFAGYGLVMGLMGRQASNNIRRNVLYVAAAGYTLVSG